MSFNKRTDILDVFDFYNFFWAGGERLLSDDASHSAGMIREAILIARSAIISSEPPMITIPLTSLYIRSTRSPCPLRV